jgi:TolB-like protein
LEYKETGTGIKTKPTEEIRQEIKRDEDVRKSITISRKRLAGILGGLIGIIASVFAVLYFSNIIGGGKLTKEIEKSIAVLPFVNESPVDSNKHFINGVMEEILNRLQTIKEFRVLSRTSTDQYKGPDRPTMPEIARKLGVSYVVEGSGQKYGNIFTLRVQLIRAKGKETHIWGKTYNEEIWEVKDYVRIQSQIAQAIALELKTVISPEEKQLIEKTPTTSLTAYDFFQKGRDEYIKYWIHNDNREALEKAEGLYYKALEYDSAFAKAYTGLQEYIGTSIFSKIISQRIFKILLLFFAIMLLPLIINYQMHIL